MSAVEEYEQHRNDTLNGAPTPHVLDLADAAIAELEAENKRLQGELNIIERNNTDHIATALDTNEALFKAEAELQQWKAGFDSMQKDAVALETALAALKDENGHLRGLLLVIGSSHPHLVPHIDAYLAAREETP